MKVTAAQKNLIRSLAGLEERNPRMKASVYEAAEKNGLITYAASDYRAALTDLGRELAGN